MKVYLLSAGAYENEAPIAVYPTLDAAKAAVPVPEWGRLRREYNGHDLTTPTHDAAWQGDEEVSHITFIVRRFGEPYEMEEIFSIYELEFYE